MQKFNIPCIKTGDFARLCNTNKRTLFHYDDIGLFSPAFTDEKGYRFYTEGQCDVFFTITCLKELGMPLKEIKEYIDSRSPSNLKALLLEQQKKIRREMENLLRIEQVIQTKLDLVNTGEKLSFSGRFSPVSIERHPEEYLITSPYLNTDDHNALFNAICSHLSYLSHRHLSTGHPYGAMLSTASLKEENTSTYAFFFTKVSSPPEDESFRIKPEGSYAVLYLRGNYYDADEAYRRIFSYIEAQNLTPGEYCYKEAIWDEVALDTAEAYITRISIPVFF